MDTATIRRAAVEVNRALVAELAAMPEHVWDSPSDCAGWSIGAVVVHLTQVAELLGGSVTRGLAGDPGPPPEAAEGIPAWRAWRAGLLRQALGQPPVQLLATYRARAAEMDATLGTIDGAPPEARGWHPAGQMPLAWFAEQWLFEVALHDWDIRVALDPSARLRPGSESAFAATLPARLGRGFGGTDDPSLAGRYRINLAGDPPLTWVAQVADGAVAPLYGDDGPVEVTIHSDPEAFGLVMTNRRAVDDFEAAGRWRAEGDSARATAFARAFRSY